MERDRKMQPVKILNFKLPNIFYIIRKYLGIFFDILYYIMFTVQIVNMFLNTTQFQIPWVEWMQKEDFRSFLINDFLFHPQNVLLILIVCRYIFSCAFDIKMCLLAGVIYTCAHFSFQTSGEEGVFVYLLLMLGARGLSFRKLMQWYCIWIEGMLALTIMASQTGYVENLVYQVQGRNARVSFGFIYPTVFAAHLFFVFLCFWYLVNKNWNRMLAVAALMAAGFVYVGCEARFTTACFMLLAAVLAFRGCVKCRIDAWLSSLLMLIPLLCPLVIHIVSICFQSNIRWMDWLNRVASGRLGLAKKGMEVYGFSLWGHEIPMVGYGGTTELSARYFYLDSIYLQLSLISGLAVFGIVLFMLLLTGYRAKQAEEWVFLWILTFAGIHGLFEEHLLNVSMCPFLLAAFAGLGKRNRKVHTEKVKEKLDDEKSKR